MASGGALVIVPSRPLLAVHAQLLAMAGARRCSGGCTLVCRCGCNGVGPCMGPFLDICGHVAAAEHCMRGKGMHSALLCSVGVLALYFSIGPHEIGCEPAAAGASLFDCVMHVLACMQRLTAPCGRV
jgi:hypothetical protein